ncbi:MAG: TolC family protein [Bacteroidales bacterium]|nr:TolC family protein [Bacteroidales bacterium]
MKALLIALALGMAPTDSLPDLSHPWNLQECIDWALENNLNVAASEVTLESRKVDDNTARMRWLPGASASVSENWNFGRGIGGNNTYERGNSSTTGFSVGANMTLFDGLATPRRMQLSRLNLEAATKDLEKARDDVRVKVAQAYVQILYNYEIHEVARRQVRIDSLQVVRLQGLYDSGRASAAELSQQKATEAQSRVTLTQSESNIRSSVLDLAQLLEFPVWEGFSIVRPPVTFTERMLPDPDEIFADALGIRPAIRAEELRLKSAEKQIQIARAGYYPTLTLNGGLGTNYYTTFNSQGFWNQLSNNFSQYVGLSLSIPIFSRFTIRNGVRTAKLQYNSQEIQLQRAKNTLYKEIQQAWNAAVAARAKHESTQKASAAAEDAFELTKAKYENGKATVTEFNESLTRLVKAQSDALQATYECLYQTSLLEFYRGGRLEL